jgi:hypothetical protein
MGTPHRGSSYDSMGLTVQRIAAAVGFDTSDKILRSLNIDSEVLQRLRPQFRKMLDDDAFLVYSFQEGLGLKGIRGLTRKVCDIFLDWQSSHHE